MRLGFSNSGLNFSLKMVSLTLHRATPANSSQKVHGQKTSILNDVLGVKGLIIIHFLERNYLGWSIFIKK